MDHSHDNLPSSSRSSGSAFRRVGATVAVACAVTGSIIGLGAMGALAVPTSSSVAAPAFDDASTADPMTHSSAKVTFTDADRATFAASPYAEEALNLAVIWGTGVEWAEGKAGSKIAAGISLPFAAGQATTVAYTPDQERLALQLTTVDFHGIVRVAAVWGSDDLDSAKADMGALVLAHQSFPAPPAVFSDDEKARAFGLWGYTDDDAVKLAGLWQTDTHSAILRAGAELLAEHNLPL
ncbi:hypothetical protein [Agreia sp. COWG]|uniref:hypothetical protein n=1 Tax=Agreia sp. COWG TaxID=2773266 RepID=UPI001AF8D7C2|nr:hypothetical protein [Agreia sp. COWG]CAD6010194.1 conserved exported protein of unknown function [Agreia sp. COWG]